MAATTAAQSPRNHPQAVRPAAAGMGRARRPPYPSASRRHSASQAMRSTSKARREAAVVRDRRGRPPRRSSGRAEAKKAATSSGGNGGIDLPDERRGLCRNATVDIHLTGCAGRFPWLRFLPEVRSRNAHFRLPAAAAHCGPRRRPKSRNRFACRKHPPELQFDLLYHRQRENTMRGLMSGAQTVID